MTKNMRRKVETIERTVDLQRKRFRELLPKCGGLDRLAKRLAEVDNYFGTVEGNEKVRNAKRELAGEISMNRIIAAMEQLANKHTVSSTKLDKSLSRMGLGYEPKYEATKALQKKMQTAKMPK